MNDSTRAATAIDAVRAGNDEDPAKGRTYIEFTTPDAHVLDTPYSPQFSGDVEMGQPFADSGFTLNKDSVWRPEYHVPDDALPMSLNEGAKLWQVGPNGPELVAVWDSRLASFVREGP
ncbi:hypothetical protein [Demequina muriae]|uniref:Uncharacterized protein n=1 Tax=Demequina muriae TaxID=3051664 RepID=A0ABT8GFT1_9MICO|nr:hypothetical protein [Demequina sp. EGI L300058]MDN4480280.1 hypothetical protein [Demequina sp. EGI L300058]